MLQGKAAIGASLLILLYACSPTGKEARVVADASVAPSQSTSPAAPVSTQIPAGAAGVRVFMDPATGQQRAPTAAEWAEMVKRQEKERQESGAPPPKPTRPITLPDGTHGYELGDAAKMSLRACKGADGVTTVAHDCPSAPAQDAANGKVP